ncbi:MAG: oxygen-dependent coproporphyrinogen oxidase, partial [Pseudolabrys sp.]
MTALSAAETLEQRKTRARAWFETLRDDICAGLEALEDALPAKVPLGGRLAGRFVRTPWNRTDYTGAPGGGGTMAL